MAEKILKYFSATKDHHPEGRRKYQRYQVRFPIYVGLVDSEFELGFYRGTTTDISYDGMGIEIEMVDLTQESQYNNLQVGGLVLLKLELREEEKGTQKVDQQLATDKGGQAETSELAREVVHDLSGTFRWIRESEGGGLHRVRFGIQFKDIKDETKFQLFDRAVRENQARRRRRWLFTGGAVASLMLALGLIFSYVNQQELEDKLGESEKERVSLENKLELLILQQNQQKSQADMSSEERREYRRKLGRIIDQICFTYQGLD